MSDSEQALSRLDRATQRATERLNQLEARLRAYDVTLAHYRLLPTFLTVS